MKMIVVLALAAMAAAEPEADPALFYSTYGYGVHGVSPYTYGAYRPYAYGAYPYTHYAYGKRSADAEAKPEAEADPALLYNTYGYGLPYTTGVHAYSAYPYAYGHRAYSAYPYTYGTYAYGKRSAEAEPEAEAEADPALLYSTYGYGVPAYRTYSAYPYTYGARTYTYGAYPYTHYAYGKRSAEAEPKADAEADPALLYSTGLVNPVTYTHAVPAVHTYAAVPAVQQLATPVVNTVYNAQVQVAQPVVQQQVYSHVAQPLVYANPLVKVADHAVAATAAGYTHSANVGICTNNLGIQVPC